MTVGELIEELNKYPKQVSVRFSADIPGNLRSILAVEDIDFDTEISPDEPLNVDILLREVGKSVAALNGFLYETSEVIKWYEEQLGRKFTQAERACVRYQVAINKANMPKTKDLEKFGIKLGGLKFGGN